MALGAIIILGAYQAKVSQDARIYGDKVEIWGTLDPVVFSTLRLEIIDDIESFNVVSYRQISQRNFEDTLVNAIAEGRGPDVIVLPSDEIVRYRSKLVALPYETIPLRTYKDRYVDGAEIFTFPEGVYATPFAVDPLMLYWNRDLYSSAGLAKAPSTWEEMVNLVVPALTSVDNRRNILQSAIAFGEYRNLTNPKAVLMTLAMQSGSRLVYLEDDGYSVSLDKHVDATNVERPFQRSMEFFTDFSNSNSALYTWNRVQQNDKNAFLSGDLATYFGFGSEYTDLAEKNPNLNFDVAMMPQGSTATVKRTYGNFYGFAIPKSTDNLNGSYQAILTLSGSTYGDRLVERLGMVSPRRDVLAEGSLDPAIQASISSALVARGWLDPSPERTDAILLDMVDRVVSNRERIEKAVTDAIGLISREF